MSIEQALAENTAAIKELVAISRDLLSARTDAIEKIGAVAKPTTKAVDKKAEPEIRKNPEDRKENPYEGIKELIASYITATDREEERTARKEKVKALLNHEQIKKAGVDNATSADHIREDAVEKFKKNLNSFIEKGDITTPKSSGDDLDL